MYNAVQGLKSVLKQAIMWGIPYLIVIMAGQTWEFYLYGFVFSFGVNYATHRNDPPARR